MSALSPVPAPTSGVRWTDLPTPLASALPSCCLSYEQSAISSTLCFHNLTNPIFRKPFVFTSIQNARGVPYCCLPAALCVSVSLWQTPSFQQLAASFPLLALFFELVSFVFRDLQTLFAKHRGVGDRDVAFFSPLAYRERSRGATRHSSTKTPGAGDASTGPPRGGLSRRSDIQTLRRSDVLSVRLGSRSNA
jgi:hypothetical protein